MAFFPGPLINGPEPVGRRYGLLSAAAGPIDMDIHARGGGYRYIPVTCGQAHSYAIDCSGGQVVHLAKEGDPENPEVDTGSFVVYAALDCGAVGYTEEEWRRKVERRLLNGEQGAVEYALWTGLGADGTPLGIENFADNGVDIPQFATDDMTAVVAAMEDWAYREQGYGNVAYIHAPVGMAAWAATAYLIVKDGNLLKTPYGSIWVFGGGYPGTGAGGIVPPPQGAYMYITGQTTVWRSADIFIAPPNQTMDRTTNQRFLLAEREYAVGYDCFAGRALFNPGGA